jgi:hypothetical protein
LIANPYRQVHMQMQFTNPGFLELIGMQAGDILQQQREAMSVLLPRPCGGDTNPFPIHHQIRSHETRKPANLYVDAHPQESSVISTHPDLLAIANIRAQAKEAIQTSKKLSSRLGSVRARLRDLLEEGRDEPPDPGPQITPGPLIMPETWLGAVKSRRDEEEEIQATALFMEDELQTITGFNQVRKEPITTPGGGPISEAGHEEKNQHTITKLCNTPILVPVRCLKSLVMASNGLAIAGASVRGDRAPGGQEGSFRRRAGKEIEGSSSNAKNILIVNMSGARQAVRARFLAVGLFLSALLANSQQVVEHMRRVWKIRGHMEANHREGAEGQRKLILVFSEEGDRDHVVRGGPW